MVKFYRTHLEIDQERKTLLPKNKVKTIKSPSPTKEALIKSPSAKKLSDKKVVKSAKKEKNKPESDLKKSDGDISEPVLAKWAHLTESLLENRYQKLMRSITRKFLLKLESRGRWESQKNTDSASSPRKLDGDGDDGSKRSSISQRESMLSPKRSQMNNSESPEAKKNLLAHSLSAGKLGIVHNGR